MNCSRSGHLYAAEGYNYCGLAKEYFAGRILSEMGRDASLKSGSKSRRSCGWLCRIFNLLEIRSKSMSEGGDSSGACYSKEFGSISICPEVDLSMAFVKFN